MSDERFTLRTRRGGWFAIVREVADHDFDPPVWVAHEEIGRFRSREDARLFMIARQEQKA